MVQTMTDAYDALPSGTKERVFLLAVGRDQFTSADQNFCKGSFGMCHDEPNDPWWSSWSAAQRDVFFFRRVGGDDWEYFCHYSMNQYQPQFADTVSDMLALIPTTTATTTTAAIVTNEQEGNGSTNNTNTTGGNDLMDMEEFFFSENASNTNVTNISIASEVEEEEEMEEEEEVGEEEEVQGEDEEEDIDVAIERTFVEDVPKESARPAETQQQAKIEEAIHSAGACSHVAWILSPALGLALALNWMA